MKPCRTIDRRMAARTRARRRRFACIREAAQVHVAVPETDRLVDVRPVVGRKRRRLGLREDLHHAVAELDLAGRYLVVLAPLGPAPHGSFDLQDPFGTDVHRPVHDALRHARVVADVHEREMLAVLAPARHPPAEPDALPLVARSQARRTGASASTSRSCVVRRPRALLTSSSPPHAPF